MPDSAPPSARSGATPPTGKSQVCVNLPDPAPLTTDRWIALEVRFNHGKLELAAASPIQTRRPEVTKRVIGRFAAELWIGCELIDRVRFDFPLLAADTDPKRPHDPNFEASANFVTKLLVPDSERATRLELVDRSHQSRTPLDWPLRLLTPPATR